MVLSLSKDFDSDRLRSPLRASLEQGVKHRVETCMKANSFLAGADSRILRIRESCRLGMLVCRDAGVAIFVGSSEV